MVPMRGKYGFRNLVLVDSTFVTAILKHRKPFGLGEILATFMGRIIDPWHTNDSTGHIAA